MSFSGGNASLCQLTTSIAQPSASPSSFVCGAISTQAVILDFAAPSAFVVSDAFELLH